MKTLPIIIAVTLLASLPLQAQIVADGATNTLSNVTTNISGDVTIGTNGSFTLLVLSDNALLTNSGSGIIGLNSTAKSNEVRLVSASARWRVGGSLLVGSNGAMSRLVVSNGALLTDNNGRLAFRVESSNNLALVTGSGSLWSNVNTLTIGNSGRDNQLIVSNGGWVVSQNGDVGGNATASNNVALVTGSGSVWSNVSNLRVGALSPGNRLVIEGGGLVHSAGGTVGQSGSASNNSVLVTGPGSLWTNDGGLLLGSQIGFNRLVVSNGAAVRSVSGGMGSLAAAVSNQVVVTGAGSVWSNQTTLFVGGNSAGNRADVNNGGWLACNDGSVGSGFSGNSNTVVLSGASGWNNLGTLKVGDGGSGNVLIASNGAMVLSSNVFMGANTSLGNNNLAVITGAGTLWSNRHDFIVGNFSVGNRLEVTNSGKVFVNGSAFLGVNSSASNNSVLVAGAGTIWTVASNLYVGSNAPFNQLLIRDSARVISGDGEIGSDLGGVFGLKNVAVVDGTGSVWSNRNALLVGNHGIGSRLIVTNGGRVDSKFALLSASLGGSHNEAVVTGPGSVWNNSLFLRVGASGSDSRLEVRNGGHLSSNSGDIGGSSSGANNQVTVTDPGSVWTNASTLSVGSLGTGNRLVISNAAEVFASGTFVGDATLGSNCQVVVDGGSLRLTDGAGEGFLNVLRGTNLLNAGVIEVDELRLTNTQGFFEFNGGTLITRGAVVSNGVPFVVGRSGATPAIWDVRAGVSNTFIAGDLMIGGNASFSQLLLTNGALLENNNGVLGSNNSSSNNLALVTGAGSSWINRSELRIGGSSRGNQLVVSNGGTVFTGAERILGNSSGADSNLVIVTDPGSLWHGGEGFSVGHSGAFNRLIVTNGGQVAGVDVSIGAATGGNSNQVLVTDVGSLLTSDTDAFVGENGRANLLVVSNSALVVNSNGYIGFATASSNNVAVISGQGTTWSNRGTLFVGESGGGNRLVVSDGARVESRFATVGDFASASNNEVVVSGPGSFWRIEQGLKIGIFGSGNRMVIIDGAKVRSADARLGFLTSSNNEVLVTGPGSAWSSLSTLRVGETGGGCRLVVSNGAEVVDEAAEVAVGVGSSSINNRIVVDGGTLRATHPIRGLLEVRRGIVILNAGLIDLNQLLLTNAQGLLQFNGGTLSVNSSRVSNGTLFRVGDGVSPAIMILAGNGLHEFNSVLAVSISSNATLTGNGTIGGTIPLQLLAGSRLMPGASIGTIIFSNSPSLRGTVVMEISKDGATLTNDQIRVIAPLTYGGSLVVSNLGPAALTVGDRFLLFTATSIAGSFSNIALPPLASGLDWTNKLGVDGSIEVISLPQPAFANITLSGTNLIVSGTNGAPGASYTVLTATNIALPLSNWVGVATNQFDSSGNFSFTNAIAPGELQRYFGIRTP